MEKNIRKGYCSLDVGRNESFALIDQLSEQLPVEMVCAAFEISRSSYYEHRQRRNRIDVERLTLKANVNWLFKKSRSAAGSRSIKGLLEREGIQIGRFKVRSLMRELGLICKQPGPHAYKQATVERVDIPNHLDREFVVEQPNRVWCGDMTYIWSSRSWSYLAVVLDLYARRVVGWAMSSSPDASGSQSTGSCLGTTRPACSGDVPFKSGKSVCQPQVPPAVMALPDEAEHEPTRKLLGQRTDGEVFRSLKTEWVPTIGYRNLSEAKRDVAEYLMGYYNQQRPHVFNGGTSPMAAEEKLKTPPGIS